VGGFLDALVGPRPERTGNTSIHWMDDGDTCSVDRVLGRTGVVVVASEDPGAALAARADRRRALRQARQAEGTPTGEDVEAELLAIFRQLFGTEAVGPHDDFHRL